MENKHLSASQLNTLLSCEAKFFFRYVLEHKVMPSGALTFGSSYDSALNFNAEQKISSKQDLKTSDIQDVFSTTFDKLAPETDFKDDDKGEMKDTGVKLIEAYRNEIAPLVQPIAVQQEYNVKIGGVDVLGFTDIETETIVIDNKTTSKTPSTVSNDYLIQSSTYKIMTGKDVELHFGVKLKKPKTTILSVDTSKTNIKYVENLYQVMNERKDLILNDKIKIIPNRNSNLCSKKWCGYCELCELKFGGKVKE